MKFHSLRLTAGEKDLDEWNRWWRLQGEHLECKSCGWAQWPIQSNTPFTHAPDCSMPAPTITFHGEISDGSPPR